MKTKENPIREPDTNVQAGPRFKLKWILVGHAFLAIVAFFIYPLLLWSQVAMASFWLALGKGPIWSRLLWMVSAGFILGILMVNPSTPSVAIPSLLWTVVFTCLFAGIGVVVLGQIPQWALLRVQFRFWELLVGMACLGFGFFVVDLLGNLDATPRALWKVMYYILISSGLLGLGTAAIGMILLARPGLPRKVVQGIALLITILIPSFDYLACETLQYYPDRTEDRVQFYLTNLAIVWTTVLLYLDALNSGEQMIFETNVDESTMEERNP
ncbi:hypothetical protein C5Y96_08030 [Blastopirellula marina]|uniref:Transmembrane protein n=1 Tax=Blastopirellula marina TaxID=124 RepID=A0A2S8FY38_9BACT|nr:MULTISPECIES: hypothetical protein [Pirellulaceae]PQO37097.1 hypothetical protein C5Y96_08030 [Blastopirellula marina]RCS53812.1 hypothetical protein DTL36_08040 [Bremerella cremea]